MPVTGSSLGAAVRRLSAVGTLLVLTTTTLAFGATSATAAPAPAARDSTAMASTDAARPGQTTASAQVGSLPIGSARYSVPSGAVFVAPSGTATGKGTQAAPYGSLAFAIQKAPSGATLVLKGGSYRESVSVPRGKALTIQPAPGEGVWLDGSSPVTGWQKSGTTWRVSGWNHIFDHRVSFSAGVDETSRWTDKARPLAGHPDQVWIDNAPQTQVATRAAVTPGTFFVDAAAKELVLGTDPTGKKVEASTLQKALTIQGEGTVVRGIGIRRYATTVSQMGAVTAEVPRIRMENLVVSQNAATGVYLWADDARLTRVTISENGLLGVGANKANRLNITGSLVVRNNSEGFKPAPVSGGVKITASEGVRIDGNRFEANLTNGLWFDVSSYNATVLRNTFTANGNHSLLFELSERAVIADNIFRDSKNTGLMIYNSGTVDVWNNTFVGNSRSLWLMQDERRQETASLATKIPWLVRAVTVKNNVVAYGSGGCPLLTQDKTLRWAGNDFGMTLDANVYHRASTTQPSNFACWADRAAGTRSFKTLDTFRAHTGGDKRSVLRQGAPVVGADGRLTAAAARDNSSVAVGLPSAIASTLGVAVDTRTLGALSAAR